MLGLFSSVPVTGAFAENPGDSPSAGSTEFLTLRSKVFSNTRTIRVWLPAGYEQTASTRRKYPVLYFTDGVAVFHGRKADEVAARLIASGQIPAIIIVGIDNGGSARESKHPGTDRANEYLPFPDEFLEPPVPNPLGRLFPKFLEQEVRPLIERHYRTNGQMGLAGSSYGGAIALYTILKNPTRFQWLLLESPSLYIDNDRLLKMSDLQSKWPNRVYIGAGTEEGEGDAKQEMVTDVGRLKHSIGNKAVVCSLVVNGAKHDEEAWRSRLPVALAFLLSNAPCPSLQQ